MKKILSIALVLVLVLSLGATAFAGSDVANPTPSPTPTTYTDVSTVTITKTFKLTNDEGVSPAETFSFTALTCESVTDAAEGVTKADAPIPTIGDVGFAEGAATTAGATATATITLPEASAYPSFGIYTYKFKEAVPTTKTAGITYNEADLYLVVTVLQGTDGKLRVAAVHCEGNHEKGTKGTAPKTDSFTNSYENGKLTVTKSVTGNLGDKSKYFKVTVTFAAASGEVNKSTISYSGGSGNHTVAEGATVPSSGVVEIYLKDGDTFTFTNVPEGVTYIVDEDDYSADGYTTTGEVTEATAMTSNGDVTAAVVNDKTATPDTGITLDSLPYILIVAVVLAASVVMIVNKRRSEV